MGNLKRGRTRGYTLLEVMIASAILAIAITGTVGMVVTIQQHNQAVAESRVVAKACQEVMESAVFQFDEALASSNRVAALDTWASKWNATFAIDYISALLVNSKDPAMAAKNRVGKIAVQDVSPDGQDHVLYEIVVTADTGTVTMKPIRTTLVSRKAAP